MFSPSTTVQHNGPRMCGPHDSAPAGGAPGGEPWQPANLEVTEIYTNHLGHVKRIWYLSPMRAAKVQVSLRICAVSPDFPLLAHTSSESRGTFGQKARSLAPLNGWEGAVKICHDGMLEDTNSLDGAHLFIHSAE